jgi:hypothetical protein
MKQPECCLTLVFPKGLEEDMIDHLLEHPELAVGFTTVEVEGHGQVAVYHSIREQVLGRAHRVKMEVLIGREEARELVAHFKESLPNREVIWWIAPVIEFGRFA